jgi:hypothetical protein
MPRYPIVTVCLGVFLVPSTGAPALESAGTSLTASKCLGPTPEEVYFDEELLVLYMDHVAVVVIEAHTSPEPFTNGSPPRLAVQVVRSLKGDLRAGPASAIWAPPPWGGCQIGPQFAEAHRQWRETPLDAPAIGTTWIVSGRTRDGDLRFSPRCRYPHSDTIERKVKFVLEQGAAWYAAVPSSRAELEAVQLEDQKAEAAADLESLCAKATDIVIGDPGSRSNYLGNHVEVFYDCKRLLDSRPPEQRDQRPCVRADALFECRTMAQLRSTRTRDFVPVIAFLRTSDHETLDIPPQAVPNTDPRTFVFADPVNGILRATPERIERVKATLAKQAKAR